MARSVVCRIWWAAACLALGLGLASPPIQAQDKPEIRVAIEGAYPPFNYLEGDELQGFEVDLLKSLCNAMNATCTLVTHEWDGIIRGLLNHEYDAVMSSLEVTDRRKKRIAFSRRYYQIPAAMIARKDVELKAVTPDE